MSEKPGGSVPVPQLKRRGVKGLMTDVRGEMKKVHWPAPKETNRLVGVVMAVCLITVAILFTLGTAFGFALDSLLKLRGS